VIATICAVTRLAALFACWRRCRRRPSTHGYCGPMPATSTGRYRAKGNPFDRVGLGLAPRLWVRPNCVSESSRANDRCRSHAPASVFVKWPDGTSNSYLPRCLPDTVDPRGLKPRLAMIVVPDYRGFRIEVNAVATDGRSNAESSPAAPVLPG